ncbi:hypothetical protein QR680_006459 [Steinernema hermaphroditum]|uniref:DUF7747 domain-containing protein n=1 Tax=Steinernema hermaphroditum TaxID=289476 RepID=A0AA39HXW5_9BILA|nr:hypothetical protein QR680_006459 [Steinernema hermaphroditum]
MSDTNDEEIDIVNPVVDVKEEPNEIDFGDGNPYTEEEYVCERGTTIYSRTTPASCDEALRIILNLGNCVDKRLLSTRRPFMPPSCEETGDFVFVLDMRHDPNIELARKEMHFDGLSPWNTKASVRMASKLVYYKVDGKMCTRVATADSANILLRKVYGILPRCNRLSKRLFYAEDIARGEIIGYVIICYSYLRPGPMPERVSPRGQGATHERMSRLKVGADNCNLGIDLNSILPPSRELVTISIDGYPVYSNTVPNVAEVILPLILNINNIIDRNRVCSKIPFFPPECTKTGEFLFVINPTAVEDYRFVGFDGLLPWNAVDQKMDCAQLYYRIDGGQGGSPVQLIRQPSKHDANIVFRRISATLPRDCRLTKRIFYALSLPNKELAGYVLIAYSYTYPGPMPSQLYDRDEALRHLRAEKDERKLGDDSDDDIIVDDTLDDGEDNSDPITTEHGCHIYAREIPKSSEEALHFLLNTKNELNQALVSKRLPFMPPSFTGIGEFLFVISPNAVKSVKDVTVDGLAPWNSKDRKMASKFIYYRRHEDGSIEKVNERDESNIVLRKMHGVLPRCPRLTKKIFCAMDPNTEEAIGYILIGYQFRYRGAMPTPVAHGNSKNPGQAYQRMFPSALNEMKKLLKENLPADALQKLTEKAMKDESSFHHPCATPNNVHVLYNLAKFIPDRMKRVDKQSSSSSEKNAASYTAQTPQKRSIIYRAKTADLNNFPEYLQKRAAYLSNMFRFSPPRENESEDSEGEIDVVGSRSKRIRHEFTNDSGPSTSRTAFPGAYSLPGMFHPQMVPAYRGIPPSATEHATRLEWLLNNRSEHFQNVKLEGPVESVSLDPATLREAVAAALSAEQPQEAVSNGSSSPKSARSAPNLRVFRQSQSGIIQEVDPLVLISQPSTTGQHSTSEANLSGDVDNNNNEVVKDEPCEEGAANQLHQDDSIFLEKDAEMHIPKVETVDQVEVHDGDAPMYAESSELVNPQGLTAVVQHIQYSNGQVSRLPEGRQFFLGSGGELYMEWDGSSTLPEGIEVFEEDQAFE